MFAWALCNISILACFTYLSIYFDRWWIILFAVLFVSEYKHNSDNKDIKESIDESNDEC